MIEKTSTPMTVQEEKVVAKSCDRCHKRVVSDDYVEFGSFFHFRWEGGYASIWGDGVEVEVDLCERCTYSLLAPFARADSGAGFKPVSAQTTI